MDFLLKKKLAKHYAEALKSIIHTEEELIQLNQSYQLFNKILLQFPEILRYLNNKSVPVKKRVSLFEKIIDFINPPSYLRNLGIALIKRGRVSLISEIANIFSKEMDTWLNRVEANVITVCPLSSDAENILKKSLEDFTEKKVRLVKRTDPKIIGGLIVEFYGITFDFSYRTQLDKMKDMILKESKEFYFGHTH